MATEQKIAYPLHVFRFQVEFKEAKLNANEGADLSLCGGRFSECTGLEATMEPKVIKEGGRNYGAAQRVGPVTFGTVILKRGITENRNLWQWYEMGTLKGAYTYRLTVTVTMFDHVGKAILSWRLINALPTKFKAADLNAKGTEVGIEELHLAHEGLIPDDPGERRPE